MTGITSNSVVYTSAGTDSPFTYREADSRVAIFVDLDGTLAISPISRIIREAYAVLASASGLRLEDVESMSWTLHIELVKESKPLAFDWDYIYREVAKRLGVKESYNVENKLLEMCHLTKILDDALTVLPRLRKPNTLLILATNGLMKYQRCVIELYGLEKYFDRIVTPDSCGCLKNCERFYKVDPSISSGVVVGDNYTFDVYYPKKFGLRAIYIARSKHDPYLQWMGIDRSVEPDITIDDLRNLPKLLETLP
jgi:putative hydrolase of the HAD superfamily